MDLPFEVSIPGTKEKYVRTKDGWVLKGTKDFAPKAFAVILEKIYQEELAKEKPEEASVEEPTVEITKPEEKPETDKEKVEEPSPAPEESKPEEKPKDPEPEKTPEDKPESSEKPKVVKKPSVLEGLSKKLRAAKDGLKGAAKTKVNDVGNTIGYHLKDKGYGITSTLLGNRTADKIFGKQYESGKYKRNYTDWNAVRGNSLNNAFGTNALKFGSRPVRSIFSENNKKAGEVTANGDTSSISGKVSIISFEDTALSQLAGILNGKTKDIQDASAPELKDKEKVDFSNLVADKKYSGSTYNSVNNITTSEGGVSSGSSSPNFSGGLKGAALSLGAGLIGGVGKIASGTLKMGTGSSAVGSIFDHGNSTMIAGFSDSALSQLKDVFGGKNNSGVGGAVLGGLEGAGLVGMGAAILAALPEIIAAVLATGVIALAVVGIKKFFDGLKDWNKLTPEQKKTQTAKAGQTIAKQQESFEEYYAETHPAAKSPIAKTTPALAHPATAAKQVVKHSTPSVVPPKPIAAKTIKIGTLSVDNIELKAQPPQAGQTTISAPTLNNQTFNTKPQTTIIPSSSAGRGSLDLAFYD